MFVVIITIFIVVLSFVYAYVKNKRKFELIDKFPGPPVLPIVGNAFNYTAKSPEDVIRLILESHTKHGKSYRTKIYDDVAIWTCDLKIIATVLSNNSKILTKSSLYHFLKPWLGEGLLTNTGRKWRSHRKLMSPIFHSKYYDHFVNVFSRHGETLVKILEIYASGSATVDVLSLVYLAALDSIGEIGFDEQINAQTNPESDYVKAVTEVMDLLGARSAHFWTRNDILVNIIPWGQKQRYNEVLSTIYEFSNKVILKRRDFLVAQKTDNGSSSSNDYVDDKIVFLDSLLQSSVDGESLDNEEILDQVNTLTFNGRNSSPVAVAFVLHLLARHTDVQEKLFKDIRDVFGNDVNQPVTSQQLQELEYLDAVVKESMRLYPPIPAIGRYIEEDIRLDDGRIIPADSSLALTFFVAFRDPSNFPEPNEFRPERFDSKNTETAKIDPFAFIPFSSGPRNCIGQKYAQLLIKTFVVQVLRNYEVITNGEEPVLFPQIVLRSSNGVHIGLKKRVYSG